MKQTTFASAAWTHRDKIALQARVSGGQVPVGLHQGALSRAGEAHHATVPRLCARQLVSAQATIAPNGVDVSMLLGDQVDMVLSGPMQLR